MIDEDKMKIPECSGIYMIVLNDGKRYIGQSVNIRMRITNHFWKLDKMNKVEILSLCSEEELTNQERKFIMSLKPELNGHTVCLGRAGAVPVSAIELDLIKQKQLEIINKKGRVVTLTEVVNEIVRKGLPLVDDIE